MDFGSRLDTPEPSEFQTSPDGLLTVNHEVVIRKHTRPGSLRRNWSDEPKVGARVKNCLPDFYDFWSKIDIFAKKLIGAVFL